MPSRALQWPSLESVQISAVACVLDLFENFCHSLCGYSTIQERTRLQFFLHTAASTYFKYAVIFAVIFMVNFILFSSNFIVKCFVSLTFEHTCQRLPLHLKEPTDLSKGYNLVLTKYLPNFLASQAEIMGPQEKVFLILIFI